MRRLASIVGCLFVVTMADVALADDDAEAMIARGVELREKGHDEEALALFKKAYAKSPTPRARAQVALAEQALGVWVAAEADLVEALAASSDPWIAKNTAALEGALGVIRRHVGGLEIRGADGAEVRVDGVVVGTASPGVAFRVEAGRRTLELRVAGHHPTTRTIEVPAGGVARETVTLVAVSHDDGGTGGPSNARPRDVDDDPGRGQRLLGWAFAGTGGALLVTGGVGLVIRKGIVDDYNADPACPGIGKPQPPACEREVESQQTWLTVSAISLVAGGVFAVGGALLLLTAPRREPAKTTGFYCSFGGCGGTF